MFTDDFCTAARCSSIFPHSAGAADRSEGYVTSSSPCGEGEISVGGGCGSMYSLPPPPLRLFVVVLLLRIYCAYFWLNEIFPTSSYDFISLSGYGRLLHTTRSKVRTGHNTSTSSLPPCPLLPFQSSFQTGNYFQPNIPYFWSLEDIELDEKAASDEMKIQVGGSWRKIIHTYG